jgi:NADPH2 dehydrogenase
MKMKDPVPQFTHFVSSLARDHPNLAYLHVVEPPALEEREVPEESNDFLRKIWAPRPFISCGLYTRETAIEAAEKMGDIIAFGHHFTSNVRHSLFNPLL